MLPTLIVLLVVLPVVVVLVQVDDVRRDLTTNYAETSWGAADTLLRPLSTSEPTSSVVASIKDVASSLAGWELVDEEVKESEATLSFVRTSRLFRFKDDVRIRIDDRGTDRLVTATSRSRIGKGDLGQNPRNLRALLGAARKRLVPSPAPPRQ
jgi:uncharacterized protein (DUF1499 family)